MSFICEGIGNELAWALESNPISNADKQQRDISITNSTSNGTLLSVLTVPALPINNGIRFSCTLFNDSDNSHTSSDSAYLTVIGKIMTAIDMVYSLSIRYHTSRKPHLILEHY